MMKVILGVLLCLSSSTLAFIFVPRRVDYPAYYAITNALMIASTGRSGSTLLTRELEAQAKNYVVLKTHLFPPDPAFQGKILFVFSDPDQATESALRRSLRQPNFCYDHFNVLEGADRAWVKKMGNTLNQTAERNLLAYDGLGLEKQLVRWLGLPKSGRDNAQVMAIKYENLWDVETVEAVKGFLGLQSFVLPPRKKRGARAEELNEREREFRVLYNQGSFEQPRYAAYKAARMLWEKASPFAFLRLAPLKKEDLFSQPLLVRPVSSKVRKKETQSKKRRQ